MKNNYKSMCKNWTLTLILNTLQKLIWEIIIDLMHYRLKCKCQHTSFKKKSKRIFMILE